MFYMYNVHTVVAEDRARGSARGNYKTVETWATWVTRSERAEKHALTPRRSCCVWRPDTQAGSKFLERCSGQALRHHVRELLCSRYMKNTELAERDLFPNKVDVELDVLSPTMMHRVRRHVDGGDVVAEDNRGLGDGNLEFTEELPEPSAFRDDVGNGAIFGLGAGARDGGLAFG
jgi:hypothetical protein